MGNFIGKAESLDPVAEAAQQDLVASFEEELLRAEVAVVTLTPPTYRVTEAGDFRITEDGFFLIL